MAAPAVAAMRRPQPDFAPNELMSHRGHNSSGVTIRVEVRLFNSLAAHGGPGGNIREMELEAGATIEDILTSLRLPREKVHYVLRNGRDVTPRLGAPVEVGVFLEDGDVVALSGPVPYSWGYGAPVM